VRGWVSGCYGRLWPWASGTSSGRRLTVHSSQSCRQEGGAALFPDRPVLPRGFVLRGPPNLGGALGPTPRCKTARRANLRSGTVHSRRCGSGQGGWAPGARDSNPTDPLGRPEVPVPWGVTWSVGSVGSADAGRAGGCVSAGAWARSGPRGCGVRRVSGARARSGPRGEAGAVGLVGPGPGLGPGAVAGAVGSAGRGLEAGWRTWASRRG